jgi:hypothetical protein
VRSLYDTDFILHLKDLAVEVLRQGADFGEPPRGRVVRPRTEREDYLVSTLLAAGEIGVACDQLNYALAYLSGYRSRRTQAGDLITRVDYVVYQLENLYLRLGMVPDRCLRLANVVFRLGLPPREVSGRTVADNEHVRATPVRARLRAIDKLISPYRETRNTIAHSERYSDRDLSDIEGYFILEKAEIPFKDPVVNQLRQMMKSETDRYVDEKREAFAPVVEAVVREVGGYFDSLLPPFRKAHGAFS